MHLFTQLFNYVLLTTAKKGIDESHGVSHSMNVLHFAHDIYQSEVASFPILKKQERIIYVSAVIHDMCDKKYMKEEEGIQEIEQLLMSDKNEKYSENFGGEGCRCRSPPVPCDHTHVRWNMHMTRGWAYDKGGAYDNGVAYDKGGAYDNGGHSEIDTKNYNDNQGLTSGEITVIKQIIHTMSYSKVKANGYPYLGPYQRAYHIVREADLLTAYDFDRSMIYHMNRNKCDLRESYDNAFELFQNRVLRHNDDELFVTPYSKNLSKRLHANSLLRIQNWQRILNKPHKVLR